MVVARRVSATFKDLPGGQVLGATFDYTHRLLDFDLESPGEMPDAESFDADVVHGTVPRITDLINNEDGMIEPTITGCLKNPSKNTPQGPSMRLIRRLILLGSASRASSVLVMLEMGPA